MVKWPRRLRGGKIYKHPVISLDILPTAAAAAGAKPPEDRKLDGVNLLPYLSGEKKTAPHEMLFWRTGQNHAIRKGNWKLVTQGSETGLFDLSSDIGESRDLKAEKPDVVKQLQETFEKWNSELAEPLWGQGARPRTATRRM
jgi:arylsulfatase A-like enzyme